jgi:hypothetical protein
VVAAGAVVVAAGALVVAAGAVEVAGAAVVAGALVVGLLPQAVSTMLNSATSAIRANKALLIITSLKI